jgi:Bacteriocin-protection, YdeI or OmpD-Associated
MGTLGLCPLGLRCTALLVRCVRGGAHNQRRALRDARLPRKPGRPGSVVGMFLGRPMQVPLGGSVRREGVPQARGEPACPADYDGPVSGRKVPGGVVHKLPADLRKALIANATALDAWKDITPLARNEFICWVEDAKQEMTRERRIRRTQEELEEGQRRPCCWPGCQHRERNGK